MSSIQAPQLPADFQTQWNNLVAQLKQLQKSFVLAGGVVVPNGTTDVSNDIPVPVAPQPPNGPSAGLDPLTGQPLPGTPPIIIQQGVYPVTDLKVTSGAYFTNVYADVTWEVAPASNAVAFDVIWGTLNVDNSISLQGTQRVGGNSIRLNNLIPNTMYGIQVIASNILGQAMSTPASGYFVFETTNDATIPPPVSTNGPVIVGSGATSVIVQFQPLSIEQAPDVANGNGAYRIQISNDPAFGTIVRDVYTSAWVFAFNDIYPHTTLVQPIAATDGLGVLESFSDLSMVTPGQQFTAFIDNEYIIFQAPSTNNRAAIAQRNAGLVPIPSGPESHVTGATVTFYTQTTWYARVAPLDASGNQGTWTNSTGQAAGGVTDSMLVGDLNAARITFGFMSGNRIQANSISAGSISSGSITSANITLAGGQFISGNPPTTGLVINSQGLTVYQNGQQTVQLNATTGVPSITAATISGGTITGGTISGTAISGSTITGGTIQTTSSIITLVSDVLTAHDTSNNPRVVLNSSGLFLYTATGASVLSIDNNGIHQSNAGIANGSTTSSSWTKITSSPNGGTVTTPTSANPFVVVSGSFSATYTANAGQKVVGMDIGIGINGAAPTAINTQAWQIAPASSTSVPPVGVTATIHPVGVGGLTPGINTFDVWIQVDSGLNTSSVPTVFFNGVFLMVLA